jgi:hypothetical protein
VDYPFPESAVVVGMNRPQTDSRWGDGGLSLQSPRSFMPVDTVGSQQYSVPRTCCDATGSQYVASSWWGSSNVEEMYVTRL